MTIKCSKCNSDNPDDTFYCGKCAAPLKPGEEIPVSLTKTLQKPSKELQIGSILAARYQITEVLGKGGMGIVYRAEDGKLKRSVALKFLPSELVSEAEAKELFLLEAQAAAGLSHPNICTIYEIEEEVESTFISMEYVKGETLREKIKRGPLVQDDVLAIAIQIAEGLDEAHKKGIIHRDIKSSNIMIDEKGQAKIMDFGLAKVVGGKLITKEAKTMGTVAYMSPEQAQGESIDHRTDIWSLGVVLYEMHSGQLPFGGENDASVLYSIVHQEPRALKGVKTDITSEFQKIINRALRKKPESRYQSATEVLEDLKHYQESLRMADLEIVGFKSFFKLIRKPLIAIPAILIVLALSLIVIWLFSRSVKIRWARNQAMPEIIRLIEEQNFRAAFQLALKAERYISEDPLLAELWPKMSRKVTIQTKPPEGDVYIKDYMATEGDWMYLGKSPIKNIKIPLAFLRWRIEKEGFRIIEAAPPLSKRSLHFPFDEERNIPSEMVRVAGGTSTLFNVESVKLEDFYLDRYEVTNKQFKEFIESGGYRKQEYWKHEFIKDGRILSWEEAIAEFRDATGRPGPSTWELGDYQEGEDEYPVTGISWYEAAAYAEFVGKRLPTVYHWIISAGLNQASYIIPLSNFSGSSPARVGVYQGMGPYGTYDMAGNVREWCWNESEGMRYIAGGTWEQPSYMFFLPDRLFPFNRSPSNGFRCMKYKSFDEISEKASKSILLNPLRDYSKEKPVSDEIFQSYKSFFSYDKTELNPVIESTDKTSKHWVKEKITFNASYGNERVIAYLFLPKNISPPYQTVIFFPSIDVQYIRSSEKLLINSIDFIVRSNRAVLYPIYKSTYERDDGFRIGDMTSIKLYRDHVILWFKEISRSIDYLKSRKDINCDKLAYYGVSWGALMGSIFLALEDRIKVSIFEHGGFWPLPVFKMVPEVDQINFAPHVKIPTLMLNGKYDNFIPLEASQKPLLHFLGTPEAQKLHITYETGHLLPRNDKIKEILDWLDRYLGPVQ